MRELALITVLCGCSAGSSPATSAPVAPLAPASEPVAAEPATCEPLPTHTVLARVALDADREIHVVGKPVRLVDAGGEYQVFDAQLLLARGGCLVSRAALGEMTRAADAALQDAPTEIQPIGTNSGNHFAIERGDVGDHDVVLVFMPLDVRWGLTEYHLVPLTMNEDRLVVGARVQSGRDAMGGERYYGRATVEQDGGVVLHRHGVGEPLRPITIRFDTSGVAQPSIPEPEPPPPPVADVDRDGHDRNHAIRVCGVQGARSRLAQSCAGAKVTREGSFGPGRDDHILDRYEVACGGVVSRVFVDIYHCP